MKYDADWMDRAACRSWPQDRFFPEEGSRTEPWRWRAAQRVCFECPVRKECLTDALLIERAGSVQLGNATMVRKDWVPDHRESCPSNCKDQKHWRVASDKVYFDTRPFTASFTPAVGVFGGFTPQQRHAPKIKHVELDEHGKCVKPSCSGCRPIDEWVGLLMEAS